MQTILKSVIWKIRKYAGSPTVVTDLFTLNGNKLPNPKDQKLLNICTSAVNPIWHSPSTHWCIFFLFFLFVSFSEAWQTGINSV